MHTAVTIMHSFLANIVHSCLLYIFYTVHCKVTYSIVLKPTGHGRPLLPGNDNCTHLFNGWIRRSLLLERSFVLFRCGCVCVCVECVSTMNVSLSS